MTHYHIRWAGAQAMAWERYETRAEAEAAAQERILPGESYTIEELGEGCTRCQWGNTDAPDAPSSRPKL